MFMESKGALNSKKAIKIDEKTLGQFWWNYKTLRPFYLKEQKGKFWIDEKQIQNLLHLRALLFAILFVASIALTVLLYINLNAIS
jgi:hypothetical protein